MYLFALLLLHTDESFHFHFHLIEVINKLLMSNVLLVINYVLLVFTLLSLLLPLSERHERRRFETLLGVWLSGRLLLLAPL